MGVRGDDVGGVSWSTSSHLDVNELAVEPDVEVLHGLRIVAMST